MSTSLYLLASLLTFAALQRTGKSTARYLLIWLFGGKHRSIDSEELIHLIMVDIFKILVLPFFAPSEPRPSSCCSECWSHSIICPSHSLHVPCSALAFHLAAEHLLQGSSA